MYTQIERKNRYRTLKKKLNSWLHFLLKFVLQKCCYPEPVKIGPAPQHCSPVCLRVWMMDWCVEKNTYRYDGRWETVASFCAQLPVPCRYTICQDFKWPVVVRSQILFCFYPVRYRYLPGYPAKLAARSLKTEVRNFILLENANAQLLITMNKIWIYESINMYFSPKICTGSFLTFL